MANFCENRLRVSGSVEQLAELRHSLAGSGESGAELLLDFNRVAPAPAELSGDSLAEWRQQHWGVDAAPGPEEVMIDEDDPAGSIDYIFATRWQPPFALIGKIALSHPELVFELCYAEFDAYWVGIADYSGGEMTSQRPAEGTPDAVISLLDEHWPEMAASARDYYNS